MNEDKKNKIKLFEEAREEDKEMFLFKQEEVHLRKGELHLREKAIQLEEEREREKAIQLEEERER
jgi:hypothetical protein